MQISELSRPLGQGFWCGTSWGSNVYYSESSAVTLILRVFNLTESTEVENPGVANSEEKVLLRLSYRFLRQSEAVLRYGPPYRPNYLGKAVRRSFCDRFYEGCDKRNCKLQSPNFPGMYPRNLTCQYRIHQATAPAGKVALIKIKQKNPHMFYIKDKNSPNIRRDKKFSLNEDCDIIHDYLVIHDGNTTTDPILFKACRGGALSSVTSSGQDLLIHFHVSSYDFPFQDSPRQKIYGFQLDVEIIPVDIDSTAYIRRPSRTLVLPPMMAQSHQYPPCNWEMKSIARRSGYIQSPKHSLLPGTTCVWRLTGGIGEVVWLSFRHYRQIVHKEMPQPKNCTNTLTIHDGAITNSSMIVHVCKVEKFPRVCGGGGGVAIACPPEESYISNSPMLSITLHYAEGTVASHVEFLAYYEFVRRHHRSLQIGEEQRCDRIFRMNSERIFTSPRDVFFFGRGGNKKLRCEYEFRAGYNQRISLRMTRSRMGGECVSKIEGSSDRYECSNKGKDEYPSLWIVEDLWSGITIRRACLCSLSQPFTIKSYTGTLKLIFNIPNMTPRDDYTDFFFDGEYDIVPASSSENRPECFAENRRLKDPHGNITIGAGVMATPCASLPRLISPPDGGFLYLTVSGFEASDTNCGIGSRVNIYGVGDYSPMVSICPEPGEAMSQVFSNGWDRKPYYNKSARIEPSRELIVEFTGNYSGRATITWISVWRPVTNALNIHSVGCVYRCPEIAACLPKELWCNRVANCPSKADEAAASCGILVALPWLTMAVGATMFFAVLLLFIGVLTKKRHPDKEAQFHTNDFGTLQSTISQKKNKKKKSKEIRSEFENNGNSLILTQVRILSIKEIE